LWSGSESQVKGLAHGSSDRAASEGIPSEDGLAKWIIVVPVTLVVLVIARDPVFWQRYFLTLMGATAALHQPRERIAGSAEPLAPRVVPELEALDSKSLQDAAAYAEQQDATALIVSRHEHVVFEKYWQGTDFNTVEDGQSLSRIVVALAVGAALSHRQLHWSGEPIGYFIGSLRNDPRGTITVDQLLQMSSGLRVPDTRAGLSTDVIAADLAEPLASKPGTTWAEQSADPQLAAFVIERATRMRYAEFVSENLWRPVGAGDAWIWLDRDGGAAHAECCILARQGDWIRLAQLLVRDGNYRGDEVIRPGWVPHLLVPTRGNPDFGAYLRLAKDQASGNNPYAADDLFVVAGEGGGNRLWIVPSMQLAILMMAPARAGHRPLEDDARIPNLVIRGARDYQPPQARPGADISTIVPGH
jgi:CubicO group peptidase (beta-lactamase class C family)